MTVDPSRSACFTMVSSADPDCSFAVVVPGRNWACATGTMISSANSASKIRRKDVTRVLGNGFMEAVTSGGDDVCCSFVECALICKRCAFPATMKF